MLKIFKIIIIFLFLLSSVAAENIKIFEFTEKELSELEVRKVRGCLLYTSPSPRDLG